MSIYREFEEWLERQTQSDSHRQILQLCLPKKEAALYIKAIVNAYQDTWLIGNDVTLPNAHEQNHKTYKQNKESFDFPALFTKVLSFKQVNKFLGEQCDAIVFDASNGIDLNALHASSGLITHCGLLVILTPLPSNKEQQIKTAIKLSYGEFSAGIFARLLQRTFLRYNVASISSDNRNLPIVKSRNTKNVVSSDGISLNNAQQTCFNIINDNVGQSRIDVILGARGRGKSTLLGQLAHQLLSSNINISIVAPNKNQLSVIEHILSKQCPSFDMPFMAPDLAAEDNNASTIFIIDEVASIAPDILKAIVSQHEHVILCGTTVGYEGSGQGFIQRILPFLESTHFVTQHNLNYPFRWYENDPIEVFFNQLTCSSQSLVQETIPLTEVCYAWLDKESLIMDEHLYQQIFSLLTLAHYQTSPNDIVRILDACNHKILIAYVSFEKQKHVTGVCIAIIEGGEILSDLGSAISLGKRRVQGHLTPQSLSLCVNQAELASLHYVRISRIAVRYEARNLGIGSELIKHSLDFCLNNGFHGLSTSFGLNDKLISFWIKNGFELLKIGQRVDTSSGTLSVMLINNIAINKVDIKTLQCQILLDVACNEALLNADQQNMFNAQMLHKIFIKKQAALKQEPINSIIKGMQSTINNSELKAVAHQQLTLYCMNRISASQVFAAIVYFYIQKDDPTMLKLALSLSQTHTHKHIRQNIENTIADNLKQNL